MVHCNSTAIGDVAYPCARRRWTANKERRIDFHRDLRPAEFNEDYGVPTGNCSQRSPGVWVRSWTKAEVTVNCNSMEGTITPLPRRS